MLKFLRLTKKNKKVEWVAAPDIDRRLSRLIKNLNLSWLTKDQIYALRSTNTNTRAIARIWGLGRVFQIAMNLKPTYVIEVISERFDQMGEREQDEVLLHEIAHIPKNFSGSLVPHIRRGKRKFSDLVNSLVVQYDNNKK